MSNLDILREELKKLGVATIVYDNIEQMEEDMSSGDGDDDFDIGYNEHESESIYNGYGLNLNDPVVVMDWETLFTDNTDDVTSLSQFNDSFNRNLQRNLNPQFAVK